MELLLVFVFESVLAAWPKVAPNAASRLRFSSDSNPRYKLAEWSMWMALTAATED